MDFIRKTVASLALFAMGMTFVAPVSAAARLGFTDDVEIPSWAELAIEELMDQGVISGNDDGSFAPNRQLNRAEVSKVIVLSTGIDVEIDGGPHFPDVQPNAWYYDYIETMYTYGWVNGYPDGLFRPAVGINRSEIAKMVVNAFDLEEDLSGAPHFDDVDGSDWFYSYVETAYNYDLMRGFGDGTFGPANPVTRAETSKIVYDGQLAAFPINDDLVAGTIEITLSDDTPRGTNVPYNATSVPYTTVELTASDDDDVEVSAITFTRLGLGDNDDFDNVWIEIDGFKVGNDKSVNNDDIVELRFNPPVVVPAGQTLVADVVASAKFSLNAEDNCNGGDCNIGHHNRFALVSADDIVSSASNVVGDFPIEGEEMEVADYEVSQVQFSILGANTTVDVGDNFIEIGKFRMLNTSNTNKDVELRAITFKNDGTAELEDNLENVGLYVSGEQVSAESIIDGDYVTFRLDNGVTGGYIIEDGDSRIFSLRADIVSAEASDTIIFKVDNFEDVVGVEIGTSFGIKAVYGSGADSDASCTGGTSSAEDDCAKLKTYSIDSGDLNVSRDPSSVGNQEYAPGSNDVVVLTARIVVDQPLLVDGVSIVMATGSTADGGTALADFNDRFDNFRLFLNDKLVDTENDFETGAGGDGVEDYQLDFNTTFEIAGTSILKLVTNVQDSAETGDKLKVKILSDDFQSPEYISTGDQVDSTQLLGSAEGSFLEVQVSQLIISENSGLSDGDKIVAGVDDVTFMEFMLDNNDSGDVNVTSVTIQADTTTNTDVSDENLSDGASGAPADSNGFTNFTSAIFVDGTQQGSAKNLSATGAATFNDLSVLIPSSQQKRFVVVVDTIEASASSTTTLVNEPTLAPIATDTTLDVDSTTGFSVGDIIDINGTEYALTGVAATVLTFANDAIVAGSVPADNDTVTLKHQIKFEITDVDADNIENGQTVSVLGGENSANLLCDGSGVGTTSDVLCGANTNHLPGTRFELVESGTLTVSRSSVIGSDIIIAGSEDVDVLKVSLAASDDEVQITDLYFENEAAFGTDIGDRVTFKLYDANRQFIQGKTMIAGGLHFQLGNNERIRVPKDDSTFVTIAVDVSDIDKADQTGARLQLGLDLDGSTEESPYDGVEAVTAATGNDIVVANDGWGDVTGEIMIAYRTELTIAPVAKTSQPSMPFPSTTSSEFYRFTVKADAAYKAEIGRLVVETSLSGLDFAANATFEAQAVIDGSPNASQTFTVTPTKSTLAGDTKTFLVIDLDGERIAANETRTYALFGSGVVEDAAGADASDGVTVKLLRDAYYASATNKADKEADTFGTAYAPVDLAGTTTTFVVSDTNAALLALSADDFAVISDADGAESKVRITASSSAAGNTTLTFAPALAAAANVAANDTIKKVTNFPLVIWSDESAQGHGDSTLDWLSGFQLNVDTSGMKIAK